MADVKVLIDVLQREGFGISTASECPAGKEDQARKCCACGWAGKRGDTIGMGWCPKCRAPTEPA
jgi:hypothetical protein